MKRSNNEFQDSFVWFLGFIFFAILQSVVCLFFLAFCIISLDTGFSWRVIEKRKAEIDAKIKLEEKRKRLEYLKEKHPCNSCQKSELEIETIGCEYICSSMRYSLVQGFEKELVSLKEQQQ